MANFVPPIRSVPSSLSGGVSIHFVIDQKSLQDLSRQIDSAVRQSAKGVVVELSHRAVEFLSQADAGAGRNYLASRWTNTRPEVDGAGNVSITVWNAAENELFYTRSNAPNSRFLYPISGKRLLNIILNGAKAHTIAARSASNPLQFPAVGGERQSRFAGAAFLSGGFGVARFLNPRRADSIVKADVVYHPGIVPSRFLQAASQLVEQVAAAEGEEIAGRVITNISAGTIGETF